MNPAAAGGITEEPAVVPGKPEGVQMTPPQGAPDPFAPSTPDKKDAGTPEKPDVDSDPFQ